MGYSTRFLAPGTISTARDPPVHGNLEVNKTREFSHSGRFVGYSTRSFLDPATISTARDPRYTVNCKSTKLVNFVILAVSWAIAHCFFGSGDDFNGP